MLQAEQVLQERHSKRQKAEGRRQRTEGLLLLRSRFSRYICPNL
jgi:hypothetical protein